MFLCSFILCSAFNNVNGFYVLSAFLCSFCLLSFFVLPLIMSMFFLPVSARIMSTFQCSDIPCSFWLCFCLYDVYDSMFLLPVFCPYYVYVSVFLLSKFCPFYIDFYRCSFCVLFILFHWFLDQVLFVQSYSALAFIPIVIGFLFRLFTYLCSACFWKIFLVKGTAWER